jgi:hypothetical protein
MSQAVIVESNESERGVKSVAAKEGTCPRCGTSAVTRTGAPDGSNAWFISACERCCFSWRSTEDVTQVLTIAGDKIYQLRESEIAQLPAAVLVTA